MRKRKLACTVGTIGLRGCSTSDKPVAVNNHAMDALKYAFSRVLEGLYQGQTARYNQYKAQVRALQDAMSQGDPYTGY